MRKWAFLNLMLRDVLDLRLSSGIFSFYNLLNTTIAAKNAHNLTTKRGRREGK